MTVTFTFILLITLLFSTLTRWLSLRLPARIEVFLVESIWTLLPGLLAPILAIRGDGYLPRTLLIAGMLVFWSLRRGSLLARKTWLALRMPSAPDAPSIHKRSVAYGISILAVPALLTPLVLASRNPSDFFSPIEILGMLFWGAGFLVAAVAEGFFPRARRLGGISELLLWTGLAALASTSPHGAWAFAAPVLRLVLMKMKRGTLNESSPPDSNS